MECIILYPYAEVHKNCRIKFRKRVDRYSGRHRKGESIISVIPLDGEWEEPNDVVPATRSKSESLKAKKICFIFQENREDAKRTSLNSNTYNQGGLGRYSTHESANTLQESMLLYLKDNLNNAMVLLNDFRLHSVVQRIIYLH